MPSINFFNGESTPLVEGEIIRVTADNVVRRSLAPAALGGTIGVCTTGIRAATGPLEASFPGELAYVLLESGLTLAAGQTIYVSSSVAGRGTNVFSIGSVAVGIVKDTSQYALTGLAQALLGAGSSAPSGVTGESIVTDGIVTGAVQLASLSTAGMPEFSTVAWVKKVGDWFRLMAGTSLTADGITIVNAAGGTQQWVRTLTQNPAWQQKQQFWSVDPVSGNDENQGWGTSMAAADLVPLKTVKEWRRRTMGAFYAEGSQPTLHVLNDITDPTEGVFNNFTCAANGNSSQIPFLQLVGNVVQVGSGTLTGVALPGQDTAGTVTDTSIPTSWTVSGFVSGTSSGARRIRKVGSNVRAYITVDLGSKTARVSQPTNTPDSVQNLVIPAMANFTAGDSYVIERYTKFPCVKESAPLKALNLEFVGDSGFFSTLEGDQIAVNWCSTVQRALLTPNSARSCTAYNVAFLNGGIWQGALVMSGCVSIGPGDGLFEAAQGAVSDWHGLFNTFQGCQYILIAGVNIGRSGTLNFFDCTVPCISASGRSSISLGGVRGSGNSSYVIEMRDSGCQATSNEHDGGFSSWTAQTSFPTQVLVIDEACTFAALPLVNLVKGAWVAGDNAGTVPARFIVAQASTLNTFVSYGANSPQTDTIPQAWKIPSVRYCTDATLIASGVLGWYLTAAGNPGTWAPIIGGANALVVTTPGANSLIVPAGYSLASVFEIGGGAGGGSGGVAAAAGGGSGGNGGAYSYGVFRTAILPSTVIVTIGAGNAGGVSVGAGNGNPGTPGGDTTFGAFLIARGGTAGNPGTTTAGGGLPGSNTGSISGGGLGSAGSASGVPATNVRASGRHGGAGGGGGGNGFAGGAGQVGDAGLSTFPTAGAGGAVGSTGGTGGNGRTNDASGGGGGGGGGGGSASNGGAGGAGGLYGGGGGGGGPAPVGFSSGAGGTGQPGIAIVFFQP